MRRPSCLQIVLNNPARFSNRPHLKTPSRPCCTSLGSGLPQKPSRLAGNRSTNHLGIVAWSNSTTSYTASWSRANRDRFAAGRGCRPSAAGIEICRRPMGVGFAHPVALGQVRHRTGGHIDDGDVPLVKVTTGNRPAGIHPAEFGDHFVAEW
jgi:hypothetical protein